MPEYRQLEHYYSHEITQKNIVILGPTPPPIGGISIHIKRVIQKFKEQDNIVSTFDTTQPFSSYRKYLASLLKFLILNNPDIVYYHTLYGNELSELLLIIIVKIMMRYKLVIVDHDCRYLYTKNQLFKDRLNRLLAWVDQQIIIGNSTLKSYHDNKILLRDNYALESPFISPDLMEESTILETYPSTLCTFLTSHKPLLLVNAFQLVMLDGVDLYGIDMCIHSLYELKKMYPTIGLIIALAHRGDSEYYQHLITIIKKYNLDTNIYFLHDQKELWPLFKKIDLFLRPTASDSFGISIAEALYFDKPAIASDVCSRPEKAIIFRNRDQEDFSNKIVHTLAQMQHPTL